MKENQIFQHGLRGCIISLMIVFAGIAAMAISINYQYPEHPSCGGMLGAGFPMLFICDDWGGSSPTNSWGRITFVDLPNGGIRPIGFLIDFLFYIVLIWIALLVGTRLVPKGINSTDLWWVTFISFGFIVGLLCASLTFMSSSLYLGENYYRTSPTPVPPSPTAVETIPSDIAPISTSTP